MDFYVENDQHGRATWWLYSTKHGLEAQAGETFDDLEQARSAAREFQHGGEFARYDIRMEVPGRFRWWIWHGSEPVAVSAKQYGSRGDAEQAARRVSASLRSATGTE